jgi:FkbM family methyltransferase
MQAPLLAALLAEHEVDLSFNILDAGALPLESEPPPFHALLDVFPGSRISALELDPQVCERLNGQARSGLRYYCCALGRREEARALYETQHPMCSSLYEPDERYADLYNNMDFMRLRATHTVRTVSLNTFVREQALGAIDFIKMDIQGAELDVLQGAGPVLSAVLALVLEVEFVPLYKEQPLYGDVDAHLRERDFMLHKFLGFGGRGMKPLTHGSPNYPVQMMWSDALFTCDLMDLTGFSEEGLLKLAVLLDIYESPDVAWYLLRRYDELRATELAPAYRKLIAAPPGSTSKKPKQ